MRRVTYSPPASELPGVQTYVSLKSKEGLPTGVDREKEQALPAGAATPRSPNKGDSARDNKGDVGSPVYNGPDGSLPYHQRTLGTPGEEYGHPTKYDYGMPTRRGFETYTFMGDPDADIVTAVYKPWSLSQIRHRQRGQARTQRRQEYKRNKAKERVRHRLWYQRNKHNPALKRRQKQRRKNPARFRLRPASVLTTPEIAFVVGKGMQLGYVRSVSPMTGMVTFSLTSGRMRSLPLMVFLRSVVFLSPEDDDAMFELIDVEMGDDAYVSVDEDVVRRCAEVLGIDPDGNRMADICKVVPGGRPLVDLAPDELDIVGDHLMNEAWCDLDENPDPDADTDPHQTKLYYGEVDDPDQRVANELGLYETQETSGVCYQAAPSDACKPAVDRIPGNQIPQPVVDGGPSSRVVLPGEGQFVKSAATIDDILNRTSATVQGRAKGIKARLVRADPKGGIWTFKVAGSEGDYTVRVKGVRKSTIKELRKAHVQVSCSCPFWQWQGPEHHAKVEGYLYGKPQGTADPPTVKDPHKQHLACKHVLSVFRLARNYRFSSNAGIFFRSDMLVEYVASPERVAGMYLERIR